jgi:hypothetical protein
LWLFSYLGLGYPIPYFPIVPKKPEADPINSSPPINKSCLTSTKQSGKKKPTPLRASFYKLNLTYSRSLWYSLSLR